MGKTIMNWNDEALVARLTELLIKGLTAKQIAEEMDAPSRSAIAGAVNRLKRAGILHVGFFRATGQHDRPIIPRTRKPPKQRQRKRIDQRTEAIAAKKEVETTIFHTKRKGVSLEKIKHGKCRWPIRDNPFRFCGISATVGSYCEFHANRSSRSIVYNRRASYYTPRTRDYYR